jgi:hypothetical protein
VQANGEIISTIIALRDETVFAVSTNAHRSDFDSIPTVSNEFMLGSRRSPSQLENREDHWPGRSNIQLAISLTAIRLLVGFCGHMFFSFFVGWFGC